MNELTIPDFRAQQVESNMQIFNRAKLGVNTQVFYSFAAAIKMANKSLASILHLSSRTINNYHQNKQSLEPVQGEHLLKLISLYAKGVEIFGNVDEFNYWLNKAFWNSTEKPLDWLITPGGVDLVLQELEQLGYGYPV